MARCGHEPDARGGVGLLDGLCSKCRGFTPEDYMTYLNVKMHLEHREHKAAKNEMCLLCLVPSEPKAGTESNPGKVD